MNNILDKIKQKANADITFLNERCEECRRQLMLKDGERYCFYCSQIREHDKKLAAEAQRNEAATKKRKLVDNFKNDSLLNEDLKQATFKTYIPKNETQAEAKLLAQRYAYDYNPKDPKNIMLFGSYGVGKSHLAISALKELMRKDVSCLFISMPKLLTKLRSTYNRNSDQSESDVLNALIQCDVVVIDDLGADVDELRNEASAWALSKVFEVIDGRQGKHTIYTTNLDKMTLFKCYGPRNASRAFYRTDVLTVTGDNYRITN